jgi:hypothetical protein
MPSVQDGGLSAVIGFTIPANRLDHDDSIYLKEYISGRIRPNEKIRVPVTDLRPELESGTLPSVADQLNERGFAVFKHHTDFVKQITIEDGTQGYLDESAELLRSALGCTRVIAWNSVVRKNDPEVREKKVVPQSGPEGEIPVSRVQPIAGVAHVDQNDVS